MKQNPHEHFSFLACSIGALQRIYYKLLHWLPQSMALRLRTHTLLRPLNLNFGQVAAFQNKIGSMIKTEPTKHIRNALPRRCVHSNNYGELLMRFLSILANIK